MAKSWLRDKLNLTIRLATHDVHTTRTCVLQWNATGN